MIATQLREAMSAVRSGRATDKPLGTEALSRYLEF